MDEALARAQTLVDQYAHELAATLPPGAEIFDAHVHLGHDIDGFSGGYDDLMAVNERYGISRCFMFCLDEPDRHPRFRAANDRTLAYAKRSGGRLIPFVRLDLAEEPIEEATRCLDLGAAKASGLDEADIRAMLARNATRIANGEPPLEPTPPKGGDTFSQPMA